MCKKVNIAFDWSIGAKLCNREILRLEFEPLLLHQLLIIINLKMPNNLLLGFTLKRTEVP